MTVELLCTCWVTAGDAAPGRGDERSPYPLAERIEAAGRAGFRGFGFIHADLVPAVTRYGYDGLRRLFHENGIEHIELEFLSGWWTTDAERTASDAVRRDLLEAAHELGVRHVKVSPDITGAAWDRERWVTELRSLAQEAEGAGTRLALEPMPFANIRTIGEGLALVQDVGHDALGLCVDIWHVARAGTAFADVAALPAERIVCVELNDADAHVVGSLWQDTIDHRRLCGQGDLDVPAFIQAIQATGWDGPWGTEVISEQVREMDLGSAVDAVYRTTTAQFAQVAT